MPENDQMTGFVDHICQLYYFHFPILTNISKKVKASKNNFLSAGLQILSLTFQGEKALVPGTHPEQEDTDYHTG